MIPFLLEQIGFKALRSAWSAKVHFAYALCAGGVPFWIGAARSNYTIPLLNCSKVGKAYAPLSRDSGNAG